MNSKNAELLLWATVKLKESTGYYGMFSHSVALVYLSVALSSQLLHRELFNCKNVERHIILPTAASTASE